MLNYAPGLTRIRFLHFVTVTFLCIFPRVIAYSYVGYTARKAIAGEEILLSGWRLSRLQKIS